MNARMGILWIGMIALTPHPETPATEGRCPEEIILDHQSLVSPSGETVKYELRGLISGDRGKGKLYRTPYRDQGRNVYGDRIEFSSDPSKTTEHEIVLERVTNKNSVLGARFTEDPSPARDRVLYLIKGVDVDYSRTLLLMVSSKGPQRLISFPTRCGTPRAVTLEPRSAYDGPICQEK